MATLTRQEAAAELVDGAIGAWFEGHHACAIILAGAAENGMPKPKDSVSTFDAMRVAVMKFGKCSQSDAVKLMNESHYWLKHFSDDKPGNISVEYAWIYVLRAYWKFNLTYKNANQTSNMIRFQALIDDHARPVRDFVDGLRVWISQMAEAIGAKLPPPST